MDIDIEGFSIESFMMTNNKKVSKNSLFCFELII